MKINTKGLDMKMFISFIMVAVYLTISSMTFAEGIKGKKNIPLNVKEKKISFTKRLSKTGPELKFEMYGRFKNGYLNKGHINIYDVSNTKWIQKIIINDNFEADHFDWDIERFEYNGHEVQMVDINFDGYLDLRLLDNEGATGNNWYATYLYHPSSRKFKYHYELSKLSGVKIDEDSKQIITYNRGGWCSESMGYYKITGTKLTLSKIEWTQMDRTRDKEVGGPACFKYTGIPRAKGTIIDPEDFIMEPEKLPYLRKKLKNVKEESLYESLDKRPRGLLGNPIN